MTKVKTGKRLPAKARRGEFEIEGDLSIATGALNFLIDGCLLSELVQWHFKARSEHGEPLDLGRCKVLIIPVKE